MAFVAKILSDEVDAPVILVEIALNDLFVGRHDPIQCMASRFNDAPYNFDFHVPTADLLRHLRDAI